MSKLDEPILDNEFNNPLFRVGQRNQWDPKRKYTRYQRHDNSNDSRSSNLSPQDKVLTSLKNLNNNHLATYVDRKSNARSTLIRDGKLNASDYKDKHYGYGVGGQGSKRPTAVSIFPFIGQLNNKMTYTTVN